MTLVRSRYCHYFSKSINFSNDKGVISENEVIPSEWFWLAQILTLTFGLTTKPQVNTVFHVKHV